MILALGWKGGVIGIIADGKSPIAEERGVMADGESPIADDEWPIDDGRWGTGVIKFWRLLR